MYIRFVINTLDARSGRRKGIFAGMGLLKRRDDLHPEDFKRYRALADWFNDPAAEHIARTRESS